MTEKQKAQILRETLTKRLHKLEVPSYMIDETIFIIQKTHYYKLLTLKKNFSSFTRFLLSLDYHVQEKNAYIVNISIQRTKNITSLLLQFSEFCHREKLILPMKSFSKRRKKQ